MARAIADINLEKMQDVLNPRDAKFAKRERASFSSAPLSSAKEIIVEWGPFTTTSAAEVSEAVDFLEFFTWPTNAEHASVAKSFVESLNAEDPSFVVQGEEFYGRWRMAGVRVRKEEVRSDEMEMFIQLTLREGWLQSFDFSESLVKETFTSLGNSESVTDPDDSSTLANTTSDNPEEVLVLTLPNVDPKKSHAVAKEISAALTALSTNQLVIEGENYGDASEWSFIVASTSKQDDGSGSIDYILAKSQYTINAYSNNNTSREVSVGYLWRVPKQTAQGIIDEWDAGEGRSATASYQQGSRFVDIILTATIGKQNLSTAWIPIDCDHHRRFHFAWGYTKVEVDSFLGDHSSPIGTSEDGRIIRSREVNVQTRGDGLFDSIVVENSFADHTGAEDTPDYTITLVTGTKITRQRLFGYNWSKADLDTQTFKDQFDATAAAAGVTTNLEITREDDCSFDWRGDVVTVSKIDSGKKPVAAGSGVGIGNVVQVLAHATSGEIATAMGGYTPAIGKRLQITLSPNDDETYAAVFSEISAQSPSTDDEEIALGETHGTRLQIARGHNRTLLEFQDVLATYTSGARKTHDIVLNPADDGGWDYVIREREVRHVSDFKVIGDHTLYFGLNEDDVLDTDLSGQVIRSSSIIANADGTHNYSILVSPLNSSIQDLSETVITHNKRHHQVGFNQESVPDLITGARILGYSVRYGDNGNFNYNILSQDEDVVTASATDDDHGTGGIKVDTSAGVHAAAAPTPRSSRLIDDVVDVQAEENGKVSYQRRVATRQETDKSIQAGNRGLNRLHRVSRNDDPDTLAQDSYPTAVGENVVLQAVLDDRGGLTFEKVTEQKVEQTTSLVGGTTDVARTIDKSVGDVDLDDIDQSDNVVEGTEIIWQARLLPDGSMDWDRITNVRAERSIKGMVLARLNPQLQKYGYTDTSVVFSGVGSVRSLSFGLQPGEYGVVESLSLAADGTLSGVKKVRVYDGTISTGIIGTGNGTAELMTTRQTAFSQTAANKYTMYELITRWTLTAGFEWSHETAVSKIAGGELGPSRVAKTTIFGSEQWHWVKVVKTDIIDWAAVGEPVP